MADITYAAELFKNGARFVAIPRDYTQTVSVAVFVKGGLFKESAADNGVGSLFMRSWLKSGELAEKVEFFGGQVGAGMAYDYAEFSLSVPTEHLDSVIPLLHKQFNGYKIDSKKFEQEKSILMGELEAEKDDPNSLAFQYFTEATYPNHPYSLKTDGDIASVSKLKIDDITAYGAAKFVAVDMIIAVAGSYTDKQLVAIKNVFSSLDGFTKPFEIACAGAEIKGSSSTERTDARIQQSKLYLAYTAPAAGDPNYIYAKVLSEILGGSMSSYYFTALRKDKGYAYSVGVMYPSRLCSSRMIGYIGLQQENIGDALAIMKQINENIIDSVTEDELERAKNHITGQLLAGAETNARRAWYAAFYENVGLGYDYMEKYVASLNSVTKADLKKAVYIFNSPTTVFAYNPVK